MAALHPCSAGNGHEHVALRAPRSAWNQGCKTGCLGPSRHQERCL